MPTDLLKEGLWRGNLTPDLGIGDEEHLLGGVLLQAGQARLGALGVDRPLVGVERLVDASVVCDVFPLGLLTVQLHR